MSNVMRVISIRTLREFWEQHRNAEQQLRVWYRIARAAEWRNLQEVRSSFPSADVVRIKGRDSLTVFDICGNDYRLIVRIRYDYQLINIRCVLTHREYDRNDWKE